MPYTLNINGESTELDVEGDTPLLWALRDVLGYTGTKFGCGIGQCGACTVHINGTAVRSCQLQIQNLEGTEITTIEGLGAHGLHAVQQAWIEVNVPQCGYCQSGQIMSAAALINAKPDVTDADIDIAMRGNLCRCGMYDRIRTAIHRASELKTAEDLSGNAIVQHFDPNDPLVRSYS